MVVYEQDRLVTVSRSVQFYTHLTGDAHLVRLVLVPGPNAVHDTHISDPWFLIDALTAFVRVFQEGERGRAGSSSVKRLVASPETALVAARERVDQATVDL